jgi:formylglycine-generating enzyme required for sulfatase activity/N-acetylmuramoyl-L-alanine amidase
MSNSSFKYHLIADLLNSLKAEGYAIGTGLHLRLEELLRKLPDDMPAEELGQHLSPLFAQSPKQQEAFYELFENSLKQSTHFFAQLEDQSEEDKGKDQSNRWKWLIMLLGFAFVIPPFIFFLLWLFTPAQDNRIIKPFEVNGASSKVECLSDTLDLKGLPKVSKATLIFQKDISLGSVSIDTPYCITYTADSLSGFDSLVVALELTDQRVIQAVFLPQVIGIAEEVVDNPIIDPRQQEEEEEAEQASIVFAEKIRPYDHDLLAYHIPASPWWKQFLATHFWWLKWLGLLIFTALLYVILLYRASLRKQLIADVDKKDSPPYAYHIHLPGVEKISLGSMYGYMLNRLRQRTGSEALKLDVPRTIDATIHNAGMADFQFKRQTRPPEYLLLIDQQSKRNHRARLFDYIFRSFRANEVLMERFYYDGDPRICYNAQHKDGISLQSLQQKYSSARLMILGNGLSFLDRFSGKAASWTPLLSSWKVKTLFTPKAISKWGKSERRLGRLFTVLPASLQSLNFWLEQLENEEDAEFDNWANYVQDAPRESIQIEGPLITTLQRHFSTPILKWIAACAIYPSLHWDLTLHLGQELSTDEQSLLTAENILSICRLPWFVEGQIPDYSRLQLVEWLEKEFPEESVMLRKEIIEVLKMSPPPEQSSAYEDYRMNLALNTWLTATDSRRKKDLQEEIATLTDAGGEIDVTVIKALKSEKRPLDFILPEEWKDKIYPMGLPGLGWRGEWGDIMRWGISLWLPALFFALWPWKFDINSCEDGLNISFSTQVAQQVVNNYNLCLNDAKGFYYLKEKELVMGINHDKRLPQNYIIDALNFRDWETIYALMNTPHLSYTPIFDAYIKHKDIRYLTSKGVINAYNGYFENNEAGMDSVKIFLPEFRSNIAVELFNKAVKYTRDYQEDVLDTAAVTSACYYFDLAILADSTLFSASELDDIANWCNQLDGDKNTCFVIPDRIPSIEISEMPSLESLDTSVVVVFLDELDEYNELVSKISSRIDELEKSLRNIKEEEKRKKAGINAELEDLKSRRSEFESRYDVMKRNNDYQVTKYLRSGDQVTLLEEGEDYYKIRTSKREGYIPKTYLRQATLVPCQARTEADINDPIDAEQESPTPVAPPPTRPKSKGETAAKGRYVWLLDNAHRKDTDGNRSPIFDDGKTQLFEYQLSRDIVSRMARRLDGLDVAYHILVPEENDISVQERAKRINTYESSLPKLGISIHFNSMPTSGQNSWADDGGQGIEAWYEYGVEDSRKLAAVFLSNALKGTTLKSRYLKSPPSGGFHIMTNTDIPLTLIEGGFMNIRPDATKLNDPKFRQKLADAYVQAILDIEAYGLDNAPAPIITEKDSDNDGILNDRDRCPFLEGEGTSEGCVKSAPPVYDEKEKDKILPKTTKDLDISVPEMVPVSGGRFTMGCIQGRDVEGKSQCPDEELPARQEKVDNFYIGKYEVTFTEYSAYANATKRSIPDNNNWGGGSRPVINVSWYDAVQYCNWLSEQRGYQLAYTITNNRVTFNKNANGFRLPTEVEWEFAARGGSKGAKDNHMYSGSNDQKKVAWYKMNSDYKTQSVGQKDANQLGIYDMSGNVAEWCNDRYSDFSQVKTYGDSGEVAVYRGGSWSTSSCRVAARDPWKLNNTGTAVGFRVARSY